MILILPITFYYIFSEVKNLHIIVAMQDDDSSSGDDQPIVARSEPFECGDVVLALYGSVFVLLDSGGAGKARLV